MESLIRAGGLQGFEALIKELGQDPYALLERHGIATASLANVDELISMTDATELLEESALLCQCPTLGLQLAARQDAGLLGAVAMIIRSAPTLQQTIKSAVRYLFLHSPAMEFSMKPESDLYAGCVTPSLTMHQTEFATQRQAVDAALGYMWRFLQLLTDEPVPLKGVSLPHAADGNEHAYRRFFGVPIHFEQAYAGLHFPKEALSLPLKTFDARFHQLALEQISAAAHKGKLSVADQVRRAIPRNLGEQRATKQIIADMLGMHPRTLQRRLSVENASFEQIQEDIYKQAALRFLTETDIPLTRLSDILGFKNPSAFTRSAKRWFEKSPSVLRKEARRH